MEPGLNTSHETVRHTGSTDWRGEADDWPAGGEGTPQAAAVAPASGLVRLMRGVMLAVLVIYAVVFWRDVADLTPTASAYPKVLIGLLLGLVAIEGLRMVKAVASRTPEDASDVEPAEGLWPKTVLTALLTLAYVYFFTQTGIVLASVAFVLALSVILRSSIKEIALLSLTLPLVIVLIFKYALQLRLELF